MNILGVVVRTLPENCSKVRAALEASGECEIYGEDAAQGKLIAVIEGEDDSEALGKLRRISAYENVIAADLIHIASENDPAAVTGVMPEALMQEADAQTILYGGSVHNWMAKS